MKPLLFLALTSAIVTAEEEISPVDVEEKAVVPVEMTEDEITHFLGFLTAQSGSILMLGLDEASLSNVASGLRKTLKGEFTPESISQEKLQTAVEEARARGTALQTAASEIPAMSPDSLEKMGYIVVMRAGLTDLGFGPEDADSIHAGFLEGVKGEYVDPAVIEAKMPAFEAFIQERVKTIQAKMLAEQQAAAELAKAEFQAVELEWKEKEPMTVVLETTQGAVEVKLLPQYAPIAVANFVGHVGNGYYDGLTFHRVIKDFMVQGGDPLGTGAGGESIWGKPFPDEFTQDVRFDKVGLLAMANSGPMTNGSQFFITTSTPKWLNDKHTIFGEVTVGYDLIEKISLLETGPQNKPVEEQKIIKAYLKE
ncbi:MAG: peptidylprolyl isomerase [Verrucomicrobiota bacterium]